MNFTVDFSDQELAWLSAARISETVLYRDPPLHPAGFREPLLQRLTVGHLVKRRPNRRSFATPVDANLFEQELRNTILPLLEKLIRDSRWMRWGRPGQDLGPTDKSSNPFSLDPGRCGTCTGRILDDQDA